MAISVDIGIDSYADGYIAIVVYYRASRLTLFIHINIATLNFF